MSCDPVPYKVDGEVGRFEFTTHSVAIGKRIEFRSSYDLFFGLQTNEYYRTIGFKDIAIVYGDTEKSYRKTTNLINRIRYQQEEGTRFRTLQENTEKEGLKVLDYISEKADFILQKQGYADPCQCEKTYDACTINEATELPIEQIADAASRIESTFNIENLLSNPLSYEDPEKTVNASIDDVVVKKQKETREQTDEDAKGKRKYIHNTIVHVETDKDKYVLNGKGTKDALRYILALLLNSELIGYRIQFFTDGHTALNTSILQYYKWHRNMHIILDWFHLVKKCKESLSMAMKGRVVRNDLLKQIMPCLWNGMTDKAIDILKEVNSELIKNRELLDKLLAYLDRNRPYIPCYAIRKALKLRNSSNIGEKMNDLVVSARQKRNGMSWSKKGSVALASITAAKRNNEIRRWLEKRELEFKLAA